MIRKPLLDHWLKQDKTEYYHLSKWILISFSVLLQFALRGTYWRQLSQKTLFQSKRWSEMSLTGWVYRPVFNWEVDIVQLTKDLGQTPRRCGKELWAPGLGWAKDAEEESWRQASTGSPMNMTKTFLKTPYSLVFWEVPEFGLFPYITEKFDSA